MHEATDKEYQQLLTEILKKQIVIFGPAIVTAKIKHLKNITVTDDGTVTSLLGSPRDIAGEILEAFKELSSGVVKITIEPRLVPYLKQEPEDKDQELKN